MRHLHTFVTRFCFRFQHGGIFNCDAAKFGKWILARRKVAVATIVGIVLVIGVHATDAEEPDLDDPNVRENILQEAVLRNSLEERGAKGAKLFYSKNSEIPFTGWSKMIYPNGKVEALAQLKEGKLDGRKTWWYDNGQKEREATYKDGELEGMDTWWHDNGQKKFEGTYKDEELEGVATWWNENGELIEEVTYKGGLIQRP